MGRVERTKTGETVVAGGGVAVVVAMVVAIEVAVVIGATSSTARREVSPYSGKMVVSLVEGPGFVRVAIIHLVVVEFKSLAVLDVLRLGVLARLSLLLLLLLEGLGKSGLCLLQAAGSCSHALALAA